MNDHTPITDAELDEMEGQCKFMSDGSARDICRMIAEVRMLKKELADWVTAAKEYNIVGM